MVSDGLYRLVDVYKVMDDTQLATEAIKNGVDELLGRLRRIEMEDCRCEKFGRVKVSDDATIMLGMVVDGDRGAH
jgi:hypothetical protein